MRRRFTEAQCHKLHESWWKNAWACSDSSRRGEKPSSRRCKAASKTRAAYRKLCLWR